MLRPGMTALLFCLLAARGAAQSFQPEIGPYLQNFRPDSVTICWRTATPECGRVVVTLDRSVVADVTEPASNERHTLVVEGLQPATRYLYQVGNDRALSQTFDFRTPPSGNATIRFAVFGDPQFDHKTDPKEIVRLLQQVADAEPDFILIAGDLVERGGADEDWELFWRTVCSDQARLLAQRIPIYPCLGNHEYWFGSQNGYKQPFSEQAVRKYLDFFHLPPNGAADPEHEGRYYSFTWGPTTFIVLDTCNDDTAPEYDTSKPITGGKSPGFHPGSEQYRWLERELARAQKESVFTFVMFHHSPYSAGVHGDPAERQSGYPVRVLDPLFHKYGVAAVFCGHDHVNQRSHTTRDGRDLPYLTATASKPRERMPEAKRWLSNSSGDNEYVKSFSNKTRAFMLTEIQKEGSEWLAHLTTINATGRNIDHITLGQLAPGGTDHSTRPPDHGDIRRRDHSGTTDAMATRSRQSILPDVWRDAKMLLRHTLETLTSLERHRVLGLPLDRLLHFFLAAVIFLVAARFFSRRLAALLTLVPMLLKEAVDIPAKIKFLHSGKPLTVTTDSAWDIVAGLLGMGVGIVAAALLGRRWRAQPRSTAPQELPSPADVQLRPYEARLLHGALGLFALALLIGHAAFGGKPLTHAVVATLVVLACRAFGPANVTIIAVPCVPLLIWLCNELDLHTWWYYTSDTLVLTLLVYVVGERLIKADVGVRRLPMDPLVALYALFAVAAVVWSLPEGGMTFPKGKQLMCVASGVAVYFLVGNVVRTRKHLRIGVWVLAATVGAICCVSIIELFVRPRVVFQIHPGYMLGGAEKLSVYATMMGPVVLSLAVFGRSRQRWLFALLALFAVAIVVVTASRSAWAGGTVCATTLIVFALWRRDWVLGIGGFLAAALCGVLMVAAVERAAAAPDAYRTPILREVLSLSPSKMESSFETSRGVIWRRGLAEIRERPILGRAGTESNRTAIYLNLAVDNGLVAGAALLIALLWALLRDLRLGGRVDDPLLRALVVGCAFGLVGVLVTGVGIGWAVRRDFVPLLWYLIALGPATLAVAAQTKPAPNTEQGQRRKSAPGRTDTPLTKKVEIPLRPRTRRISFHLSERMVLLIITLAAFGTAAVLLWLMFR